MLPNMLGIYYTIALVGLFLSSVFCRAFTIIALKEQRTFKAFFYLLVFAAFCFLYLVATLEWSVFWRDVGRTVLLLALALGNIFEWRDFLAKMREKNKVFHSADVTPEPHTLKTLADSGTPVSLDATPNDAGASDVKEKPHVD